MLGLHRDRGALFRLATERLADALRQWVGKKDDHRDHEADGGAGEVRVGAPISMKQRNKMLQDAGALFDHRLLRARERRAQLLVSDPRLGEPGIDELSLWVVAHNAMVFDHPELGRVWARERTWQRYLEESIEMLDLSPLQEKSEYLSRFVLSSALVDVERDDFLVRREEGMVRYRGQVPPHLRGHVFTRIGSDLSYETVRWYASEHQAGAKTLLGAIWTSCPLTCLIHPELAPVAWTPVQASDLLRDRALIRSTCYMWSRRVEWVDVGAYLLGRLLKGFGLSHGLLQETAIARGPANRAALPAASSIAALPSSPHESARNWESS